MDDITNLTPILWNAPSKPYHLKSVRYDHYDLKLPKERAYYCNLCGRMVAYTTSKTGKRFLCDARKTHHARRTRYGRATGGTYTLRRYFPNLWHSKTCTPHEGEGIHPIVREYLARVESLRDEARARAQESAPAPAPTDADWETLAHDLAFGDWMDARRGL